MSYTADVLNHHSMEFSSNWLQSLGQKESRLTPFVERINYTGDRKSFNLIGEVTAQPVLARHSDTVWSDVSMGKRWITHSPYDAAQPLDEWDAANLGEVTLPDSALVREHRRAFNKACDDDIITTAIGTVYEGATGVTPVPLPSSQIIVNGGTGMTLAKLNDALDILDDADELDGDNEGIDRCFVWTVAQRSQLLNTTEVKSADYNTVKALAEGKIDSFMGFKFILNKRLPLAGGIRTNVAWQMGSLKQMTDLRGTRIDVLPTKSHALQIRTAWRLGSTRVYDAAVVQIDCTEA